MCYCYSSLSLGCFINCKLSVFLLQSHDSWQGHDSDQVSAQCACETLAKVQSALTLVRFSFPRILAPLLSFFFTRSVPCRLAAFRSLLSARHADSVKSFRNLHVDVCWFRTNSTSPSFAVPTRRARREIFRGVAAVSTVCTSCTLDMAR